MVLQMQSIHFNADNKLIGFIEQKLSKLGVFFDRILQASVVLKLESGGKVKDKIAEIRLNLPGTVLFVRESSKSFESSVEIAINSLKRQLIKYKERRRSN